MPLDPQFRKAINARWSFKIVDMKHRLILFRNEPEGGSCIMEMGFWRW
jgi:hypothetical protein